MGRACVAYGVGEGGCIGSWWGDLGVDGWIILGWISRKWDVGVWTGLGWPRIACECGNEPSGSVKCGEFLD